VTVYYDRRVATYPASYVSIFFPAAMEMGNKAKVTGKLPPRWGIPASARGSALLEKVNLRAADGSTAWPLASHPLHPEDKSIDLTREERQILVRVMDLGGQYYSRSNTGFSAFTLDPVGGGK
jgi:hypothetical protein